MADQLGTITSACGQAWRLVLPAGQNLSYQVEDRARQAISECGGDYGIITLRSQGGFAWPAPVASALFEGAPNRVIALRRDAVGPDVPLVPAVSQAAALFLTLSQSSACGFAETLDGGEAPRWSLRHAAADGFACASLLARYPVLRRPSAPGLAFHLAIAAVVGLAMAVLGRSVALLLPILFLALSLLFNPVVRIGSRQGRGTILKRATYEVLFALGQTLGSLWRGSPGSAMCRMDRDDTIMSERFAPLVERLWCDHLALLLSAAIVVALA